LKQREDKPPPGGFDEFKAARDSTARRPEPMQATTSLDSSNNQPVITFFERSLLRRRGSTSAQLIERWASKKYTSTADIL
jgi:hypothetical protein